MKQLQDADMQYNDTTHTIEETVNRIHHERLVKLETNLVINNTSIAELQSDQFNDREMLRIISIEASVDNHQVFTADLEATVIHLESDANRTQSDVEDNNHKISLLGNTVTSLMEFSEDQREANIEIESNLTAIKIR